MKATVAKFVPAAMMKILLAVLIAGFCRAWTHPIRRGHHGQASSLRKADYETAMLDTLLTPGDFRWPDSYFDIEASSDVAVLIGQTAFLTCRVQVAGNWTVSWVRHRDIHLLTVGTDTYTADRRFRGLHVPSSPEWTLQIKATTLDDAGDYECQLSSTPLRTHIVRLKVIEPHIQILNGPEVHLHEGSTLNLTCMISPAVDASLLLWERNGQVLNWLYQSGDDQTGNREARIHVYDGRLWVDRGGGSEQEESSADTASDWAAALTSSVDAIRSESPLTDRWQDSATSTISELIVDKSQMHHSGRYFCSTLGSQGTWTQVHVLAEEEPAAMQRGNSHSRSSSHSLLACWITVHTFVIHRYLAASSFT